MIIARAPFRVSFFGGGTDFPAYYREHGGATLSTTIDKYCYLSVHRLSPFFKHRFRASYAQTETVSEPSEFQHPLIRECLLLLDVREGMEISHVSDLPGRTGLGTSSSFTVALLQALHTFAGNQPEAEILAREAITVERERVGDEGGHQDQYAAACGGLLRIDYREDGPTLRRLNPTAKGPARLEASMLMFYTGIEQSADRILREQSGRMGQNLERLQRMCTMVDTAEDLLQAGDVAGFGELLHQTWTEKKALAADITNPGIDQAYEAARQAGALGGKLLGAGGRGFLLLCAPPERHAAIREALQHLLEAPFRFSPEGSRIVFQDPE